jgi:6-phosphogluconolactonase (cycloisomerase 2 family)
MKLEKLNRFNDGLHAQHQQGFFALSRLLLFVGLFFAAVLAMAPKAAFAQLTLTNVDNVTDSGVLELNGAISVNTAVIGSTTYLFVAGSDDNGVSVFLVANDGTLTNVDNVIDDATLNLASPFFVTTAVVGGTTYLFVAGNSDNGISVFSVANDGTLTNVDNVSDAGGLKLLGALTVHTAVVGGTTYLFVAGSNDNGVSVFSVANNGTLTNVDNVADNGVLQLLGARSLTTAIIGSTTYLFVTGATDNGISVFSVANDGTLTNVDNVSDDATLNLATAFSIDSAVIGSTTYLFVAGATDNGVSVFSVANNGMLTNVANVNDDATLNLGSPRSVNTVVITGNTYLFVAGLSDNGISVFSVANDGMLANVANVSDAGALELLGAFSSTSAAIGGTTYLFVAGILDDGISVFSATAPEINVTGMGISIVDGDTTPVLADNTDFGSTDITIGMVDHTFTIQNLGGLPLNLGANAASLSGVNAADFSIITQPATSVSPSGSTTVVVRFDPSVIGVHNAMLSIANDDSNENPYDFSITGNGAVAPSGEFLVNTTTANDQFEPAITTLSGGGFVAVWTDNSAAVGRVGNFKPKKGKKLSGIAMVNDTSGSAVRAQRYDVNGVPQGGEFLVNTSTTNTQDTPAIDALSDGGFVIAWKDSSNGSDDDIRAQRYDATGTAQGGEFLVNTLTANNQHNPSIAALSGGGFVIAWEDFSVSSGAIKARRYDVTGVAQGTEFPINSISESFVGEPDMAGLSDGGFAVTWRVNALSGGDTSGGSVRVRRFDVSGMAQGIETQVNTTTINNQFSPVLAAFPAGGFVIAWEDASQTGGDTSQNAIRAQRYDATGAAQGSEFLVNTTTTKIQSLPSVTTQSNGGFIIAWDDFSNAFNDDIRAQRYDASGNKLGNEFVANTTTTSGQTRSSIAALSGDLFVIAWQDGSQTGGDTSSAAIRANIFGKPQEINVTGLGTDIADGDTIPSLADDTDFGNADIDIGLVSHTFTIQNLGGVTLNLGANAVSLSGANAADFSIMAQPTTSVVPGGATTFTVRFDPSVIGVHNATLSIANDDANESPYDFSISGTGAGSPEMDITGFSGRSIADGDVTPDLADNTDFGTVAFSGGAKDITYIIRNSGNAKLNLTGTPRVVLGGANAADFTLTADAAPTIAPGGGTTFFTLTFAPSAGGTRSATVSIANNDSNENPYTYSVQGTGINTPPFGTVIISGTTERGQTLTADTSGLADADGLGAFSYQWRRGGTGIAGATTSTYTLVQADVGSTMDVVVSYTDGAGMAESVTSAPTGTVQAIPQFTLNVATTGPGTGSLSSNPAGVDCNSDCTQDYDRGTSVTLTPAADSGSVLASWSGDCTGTGACVVIMDQDRAVSARFELVAPKPTTLFSSILPSARSGSFNGSSSSAGADSPAALGDPITVFASIINAGSDPAQSCTISVPASAPVSLSYQETDAANAPVGPANVPFDVTTGQTRSFILALTPTTLSSGKNVFPDFVCDNANVDAIPGVNTVFLSIDDHEVPDVLSIGASPSGDGVINIPSGSAGFMTASAINIGAGDVVGSADVAMTVSIDTGAAALPLLIQLCETNASSTCITPLGTAPVSTTIGDSASFFAVFVTDQSDGAGIALDPANARVFLRFTDANGIIRSVSSAAVTVPAAADLPVQSAADLPVGRWAVMVRKTTGIRHAQEPGTLYVWPDGRARLQSGGQTTALGLAPANDNTGSGTFTGIEAQGVIVGQFVPNHSLFMVSKRHNTRLDIWGVHDTRGLNQKIGETAQ